MKFACRVATFNIRNVTDRFNERLPLMKDVIHRRIHANVIGLQEVVFGPGGQTEILTKGFGLRAYEAETTQKFQAPPNDPDFKLDGNAILVKEDDGLAVTEHEILHIGDFRCAQRARVSFLEGGQEVQSFWFVNTHLHHIIDEEPIREEQTQQILDWLSESDIPIVLVGDFNAEPAKATYALIQSQGFQSAYFSVKGAEPEITFPTGLQAPTMDTDPPACLDYIWLKGPISVQDVGLEGNTSDPQDKTLFASDHMALFADLKFNF
eukprot:c4513_g1_i2.p2 GENE.c4513_g1_i2~~c4513_g1_i2.p2  ORF type:complete len:265 (-),score=64.95 c4513_g1_i2:949-1743(-)